MQPNKIEAIGSSMDGITLEKVFGSDGSQFIQLTGTLIEAIEKDPPTYTYMAPDKFNSPYRRV